jgi:hypothetical protein
MGSFTAANTLPVCIPITGAQPERHQSLVKDEITAATSPPTLVDSFFRTIVGAYGQS